MEIDTLADAVAERVMAIQLTPVWNSDQACRAVGKIRPDGSTNLSGLRKWISKYAPKAPCGNGRYSRDKIIQGLNIEEKTGSQNRSGKHLKRKK